MNNFKINKEWMVKKFMMDARREASRKFKYNFEDPLEVEMYGEIALEDLAIKLVNEKMKTLEG